MSSVEHAQAREGANDRDEDLREENERSTVDSDHCVAAEAARRQARQDPLQG